MALPTSWSRSLAKRAATRGRPSASLLCPEMLRSRLRAHLKSSARDMGSVGWLTAQPVAHRGLHDASAGVIENTAAAFSAAVAAGYGIETDLQISADGEAMVHHDDALGRLTEGSGALA